MYRDEKNVRYNCDTLSFVVFHSAFATDCIDNCNAKAFHKSLYLSNTKLPNIIFNMYIYELGEFQGTFKDKSVNPNQCFIVSASCRY